MRSALFHRPNLEDDPELLEQYCDFLKRLFDNEISYRRVC